MSIRVGTCSWADESLSALWYPKGVNGAEGRLRYYAEHFDTVEVNASYYALPTAQMATAWADRTPSNFLFHVKAFAMMTRHPVKVEQLPPELRSEAEVDERNRVHPSEELRTRVFTEFHRALQPLRDLGKLGGVLMQFPPYITYGEPALRYIEWAQQQLGGDEMLVEFRHRSWLEPDARERVLGFLRDLGASYVIVDAPRTGAKNVLPTVVAVTGPTAYLRLHGRNAATWNVRGKSAAERFDYLYSEDELREWVEPLHDLDTATGRVFAMFNNNGRSVEASTGFEIAQAPVNAAMLQEQLSATL